MYGIGDGSHLTADAHRFVPHGRTKPPTCACLASTTRPCVLSGQRTADGGSPTHACLPRRHRLLVSQTVPETIYSPTLGGMGSLENLVDCV